MSGRFQPGDQPKESAPPSPRLPDPSLPLANPKHEKFCREIVKGLTPAKAYQAAGYDTATPWIASAAATRLFKAVKVVNRVNYLQSKIANGIVQSKIMEGQEVLEKLSNMARTNMRDFFTVGADGQPLLDFSMLTPEQTESMQEIVVEEFKDGRSDKREVRRVKFKLGDKRGALELLAKHHGLLTEKHEHTHQHEHLLVALLAELDDGSHGKRIEAVENAGKMIEHEA